MGRVLGLIQSYIGALYAHLFQDSFENSLDRFLRHGIQSAPEHIHLSDSEDGADPDEPDDVEGASEDFGFAFDSSEPALSDGPDLGEASLFSTLVVAPSCSEEAAFLYASLRESVM